MTETHRQPLQEPLNFTPSQLGQVLHTVAEDVRAAGGTAYLVGGSVRDHLVGQAVRDLDIEVFGLEPDRLRSLVEARYRVDLVGQAFGVLKLRGLAVDVSLPRREFKIGRGHRGFAVDADPQLPLSVAARRRDFTINALYLDPLQGVVEDTVGGLADLDQRVLRHTSPAFGEDPLRVLRAMQFVARFELKVDPTTVGLCEKIESEGLARERIHDEWRKLILLGRTPSLGLAFLRDCRWLRYYPELEELTRCPQDPVWHPEGDTWIHTLHAMDAFAAERIGDPWEDQVVGFAVLCHDLGKPATSVVDEESGRIRSLGHDQAGEEPTRSFLRRFTDQKDLIDQVIPLVREHLKPLALHDAGAGDAAIRRLARRVGRIDRLVRVARADALGRSPHSSGEFAAGDWLLQRARELAVDESRPQPLIQGRDLVALGLSPGRHFKAILDACYEAQLDGRFTSREEGLVHAQKLIDEEEADRRDGS